MNNVFSFSKPDSNRFDINIHRANIETINQNEIYQYIYSNKVDLLILRTPVGNKPEQFLLQKVGYQVLHVDTLVYYFSALNKTTNLTLRNRLDFVQISDQNVNILNEIVPEIFSDYKNHYFSNPRLDKTKILEGYIEWAKSYVSNKENDKISWVANLNGVCVGFATCTFNDEKKECEGILYGVLPKYSGKGIYTDLIKFTQEYFKNKDFIIMWVSTQIQNFAVQKTWLNQSFILKKAFDTYHINKIDDTIQ
jgi:ribosomal protein S18 acetylase RimI-like enzyme